jgi:hypothetical protein
MLTGGLAALVEKAGITYLLGKLKKNKIKEKNRLN